MSDFGTYLRQLREHRGMSRPQVRDAVRDRWGNSFSTSTLENWESGNTYPPAPDLAKLALVLEADWDDLFRNLVAETLPQAAAPAARAEPRRHGVARNGRTPRPPGKRPGSR